MALRTTTDLVQKLLGGNYGALPDGSFPDLVQFIQAANAVVTQGMSLAAQLSRIIPVPSQQELIERWLACYFYCHLDPLYSSKSTEGASGSFVASQSLQGEQERYKRGAIELDPSGTVNALLNRQNSFAAWLGKPPSQQIPYDQRS